MILGLRWTGVRGLVAGAALVACNVDSGESSGFTQHCSELQGDATCRSVYTGRPFCSLCTANNQGCVVAAPAVICQPDGGTAVGDSSGGDEEPGTTGGSTGGTSEDPDGTAGSSTTGVYVCDSEGELDPGCMEIDPALPYCADAECVGCLDAGGDEFCGGLDELTPACDAVGGACVACGDVPRSVCTEATPVCGESGACEVCTAHDQCPGSACHLDSDDPLLGYCFAPDEVIHVDNQALPCPGVGTPEEPMCSFNAAAALAVPGSNTVLWIHGGGPPYAERASFIGDLGVALIGENEPVIAGAAAQQAATLIFEDGVIAYIDGVRVNGNALTHGVMCNFADLHIEDSEVRSNDGWGIFDFDPCSVVVDRTVISSNEDGGVRLGGGDLTLRNVAVGLNGIGGNSTGVRVLNGTVDILYSTIAGNDGSGSDSLECTAATGSLRNNIFTGANATSVSLDCFPLTMEHNAIDAANFASGTNVAVGAYQAIYFNGPTQGNFTLSAPPLTPYGGIALWLEGDPALDGDGTPRPMGGTPGYAGVDEP